MSSFTPNGKCDACRSNKPCERTLQTCKKRPGLHIGEYTCTARCWKCRILRHVKCKKENPPTVATAKKCPFVVEEKKPVLLVAKNQNPAPCGAEICEHHVQQQHPTHVQQRLSTPETSEQQQLSTIDAGTHRQPLTSSMTKKSADSASSACPIVSLISSDEEGSGDFDFQDFEPRGQQPPPTAETCSADSVSSVDPIVSLISSDEEGSGDSDFQDFEPRAQQQPPTPETCAQQLPPTAEIRVQQPSPTPETSAQQSALMTKTRAQQQPPTTAGRAQQQSPATAMDESLDISSSSQKREDIKVSRREARKHVKRKKANPPTVAIVKKCRLAVEEKNTIPLVAKNQNPTPCGAKICEHHVQQQHPTLETRTQQHPPIPTTRVQQPPPTPETCAQQRPPTPETRAQQQPPTTSGRAQQQSPATATDESLDIPSSSQTREDIKVSRRKARKQASAIAHLKLCVDGLFSSRQILADHENAYKRMNTYGVALIPNAIRLNEEIHCVIEFLCTNKDYKKTGWDDIFEKAAGDAGTRKRQQLTYDDNWNSAADSPRTLWKRVICTKIEKLLRKILPKETYKKYKKPYHTLLRSNLNCPNQAWHYDQFFPDSDVCKKRLNERDVMPFVMVTAVEEHMCTFLDVEVKGKPMRVCMKKGDVLLLRGDCLHRGTDFKYSPTNQRYHVRGHAYIDPNNFDRKANMTYVYDIYQYFQQK